MSDQHIHPQLESILQSINGFRAKVIAIETAKTQSPKKLKDLQEKLRTYGTIIHEFLGTFEMPPEAQSDTLLRSFLEEIQTSMKPWNVEKSVFVPYWCEDILNRDVNFVIEPEHCRRLLKQAHLERSARISEEE